MIEEYRISVVPTRAESFSGSVWKLLSEEEEEEGERRKEKGE